MDGAPEGLRFVRDIWGDPFAGTRRETSISNEEHIVTQVPLADPDFYGIQLAEIPKRGTVSISGYSEVFTAPAAAEFRVDYEPDDTDADRKGTAFIAFHSSENGNKVEVSYTGMGSPIKADIINELMMFQPLFGIFCGDGTDGDHTTAGNESWDATPKQYRNLTISTGHVVSPDTGVGMILLGVTERLKIQGAIDVKGKADEIVSTTGCGHYGGGGGGGGGGEAGGAGGADGDPGSTSAFKKTTPFGLGGLQGSGGGAGGGAGTAGQDGTNWYETFSYLYRDRMFRRLWGQRGGNGGTGTGAGGAAGTGGKGGTIVVIECNELELTATGIISAAGDDGTAGSAGTGSGGGGGGGGGGAGGTALIFCKTVIDDSGTVSAAGGAGGAAGVAGGTGGNGGAGGDGADGLAAIVVIRESELV